VDSKYPHLNWSEGWDSEPGLWWWNHPGHTTDTAARERVHCGPETACRLLAAGQAEMLDRIEVTTILHGLRSSQITDYSPSHGEFRWYAEETRPADLHATFFNGLVLCTFESLYGNLLAQSDRDVLQLLIRDLRCATLRHVAREAFHYPNECLGDLTCSWLAGQLLGEHAADDRLLDMMIRAADYWQTNGWGWGEHLSDTYATICLEELSLLLLLPVDVPKPVRTKYTGLFRDLNRLDDAFAGGPRVPAVRQYAFLHPPRGLWFREHVRPLPQDALLDLDPEPVGERLPTCSAPRKRAGGGTWLLLGHTLDNLGWHNLAGPAAIRKPDHTLRVPCVAGAQATAAITDSFRVGSLSRFPLMPTAEHLTWGLSWQCFPVTLWSAAGTWGYFQWETVENNQRRSHPAREKYKAYLGTALTQAVDPPVVGRTWAIQQDTDVIALRMMPAIVSTWTELTNRFRIVNDKLRSGDTVTEGVWSQTVICVGGVTLALQCVRLVDAPEPEWKSGGDGVDDWQIRCCADSLTGRHALVTLWGLSVGQPVACPPRITTDPDTVSSARTRDTTIAVRIQWSWPNRNWDLSVDLTQAEPLVETSAIADNDDDPGQSRSINVR